MSVAEAILSQVSFTKVLVVAVLCLLIHKLFKRVEDNLPPSIPTLPFIGSLPFLEKHAGKTFAKWAKKLGPIIRVKLGPHDTVILNSYESIHQERTTYCKAARRSLSRTKCWAIEQHPRTAFVKQADQFNGRFQTFFTNSVTKGDYGIMFLNSQDKWKVQRRFGLRALSGSSLQGRSLETRVVEEANMLCELIRSKEGRPFVLELDLATSVSNVIHEISMNERNDYEGNETIRFSVKRLLQGFRDDGFFWILLTVAPWCRFLPVVRQKFFKFQENVKSGEKIYNDLIKRHEREANMSHPTDFVDMFLVEEKRKTPSFERHQHIVYIKDLLAAGTETSSSTIRWILLHLIKQPKIQDKIHEEIERVVGREGKVALDSDLPYTKAVIHEAYRVETVVPLGVPRSTVEDVTFMGYRIPKNTQVIPNLWYVHNDPNLWPDPRRFDPERHLDKDGKFVKSEKVIPFSIGPRNCLGENLARIEIFLFLVCILQKFKVLPNPEQLEPCMDGTSGPVYSSPHYPIILQER